MDLLYHTSVEPSDRVASGLEASLLLHVLHSEGHHLITREDEILSDCPGQSSEQSVYLR